LKEAKDTVESAPCWIQKELGKEAADELKVRLEAVGGVIRFA
jgi:ribosomal protein L7/L12